MRSLKPCSFLPPFPYSLCSERDSEEHGPKKKKEKRYYIVADILISTGDRRPRNLRRRPRRHPARGAQIRRGEDMGDHEDRGCCSSRVKKEKKRGLISEVKSSEEIRQYWKKESVIEVKESVYAPRTFSRRLSLGGGAYLGCLSFFSFFFPCFLDPGKESDRAKKTASAFKGPRFFSGHEQESPGYPVEHITWRRRV